MMELHIMVALSLGFFLIAMLYSSVGFGGGSSYLAILSLVLVDFTQIKTLALICNLVVVVSGTIFFIREGYFDRKKFIPLALYSVPAAFLGATIHLSQKSFFIFLGIVLAISGLLLIIQVLAKKPVKNSYPPTFSPAFNFGFGAVSGFLAGLVGIGGGILISPIMNILQLEHPKKIAALASFFILVNSTAGLLGLITTKSFTVNPTLLIFLVTAVLAGGLFGTRVSLRILKPKMVVGLTGILVCYIGLKIVLKHGLSIDI